MRIILSAAGGRNEVAPMFALAAEMQRRNHTVTLCVPERYRSRVMVLEYRMVTCGADFGSFLEGDRALDGAGFVRALAAEVPAQFVSMRDSLLEADAMVCGPYMVAAASGAEQRNIPLFTMIQNPLFLDVNEHPAACVPLKAGVLGTPRNKLRRDWNVHVGGAINRERGFSGLNPVSDLHAHLFRSGHLLLAMDPDAAPLKAGAGETITGFWNFEDPIVSGDLQTLLTSGTAPVLVDRLPLPLEEAAPFVSDLCSRLVAMGHRVVLQASWPAVEGGKLPQGCQVHDVFSPRGFAAVVHTGTAGSFAAAAYAGVPQVCVPFTGEHRYWAERAQVLGVGPVPISKPSAAVVAEAVRDALSRKERCAELAGVLDSKNGTAVAADTIERFVADAGHD